MQRFPANLPETGSGSPRRPGRARGAVGGQAREPSGYALRLDPMTAARRRDPADHEPAIENRKARFDYRIGETLECGIELLGTEVKSLRAGQASLGEGWARGEGEPPRLVLHQVHIAEYPPAGAARQHDPVRPRTLLAHRREIRRFVDEARKLGGTIVPLRIHWVRGKAKVLVGIGLGKDKSDKRQDIAKREHQREMDRALRRKG